MRKTWTLSALVVVFLGATWTLQGFEILDGAFFTGRTQSIVFGIITAAAGAAMMIWANRGRWRR